MDHAIAFSISGIEVSTVERNRPLVGELFLSARDHKSVSRSILILDAVVRGRDNSDASLRVWRNLRGQPLRYYIRDNSATFPTLPVLLIGSKTGVRVIAEDAARELSVIWNEFHPGRYSAASVLDVLRKFLPIDLELHLHAPVQDAFKMARLVLNDGAL